MQFSFIKDQEVFKKEKEQQIAKVGRSDKRSMNEIRSFTVYETNSLNANSRCFFESEQNKFVCSIFGPQHPKGSSNSYDCNIQVSISYMSENTTDTVDDKQQYLELQIKKTLDNVIIKSEYVKSTIEINFQIIESNGPLFSNLINLAFFSLSTCGIMLFDTFSASTCVYVGDILLVDPDQEEYLACKNELNIVQAKNSSLIIYIHQNGAISAENLEKVFSLCINTSTTLQKYLLEKLQVSLKKQI